MGLYAGGTPFKMESALKSKWQSSEQAVKKAWAKGQFNFNPDDFIVGIGSSTGGTQALQQIFTNLPENIPPILVTQHIPAGFSKASSSDLISYVLLRLRKPRTGTILSPIGFLLLLGTII